ncbi:MAG TPA: hypothetical protein HPQ00_01360 [Magnetococcales bacterium]|nr:hypothetical protein [Magnetococcales bacterium]
MAKRQHDPFDLMEDMQTEAHNSGRFRRMRPLLRQLFKEEFETKRIHIRPIKGKELIAILSVGALFLFGLMVTKKFNRMVAMEETVLSTNGRVINALQRRSNLFSNLINLTLNQAALEQEVFRHVADVRTTMTRRDRKKNSKPPEATLAEKKLLEQNLAVAAPDAKENPSPNIPMPGIPKIEPSMANLLAVVERYPDIRSSTTYQQLMDKLVEIEDRIITRRSEYNEAVRTYNTNITTFPQYILADIIGFKIYPYATANQTLEGENFQLPNLTAPVFQRLLPLASGNAPSSDPSKTNPNPAPPQPPP